MDTISIPKQEYENMKNQISLLQDNVLLEKLNILVDLQFQYKYGLYMGDDCTDLVELAVNNIQEWNNESVWDIKH